MRRKTTEQFIEEAKRIHGDKYDYSKVNYTGALSDVEIICPVHGPFFQSPNDHLKGSGCKQCGREKTLSSIRLTQEEFLEKARKVHGDKYDYSETVYKNIRSKVTIICPKHGEFQQTPNTHLSGEGCPKCGIERSRKKKMLNTEDFVRRAREIYGNEHYDYSETDLNNRDSNGKITVNCTKHGLFKTNPSWHLSGIGCPSCGGQTSKAEDEIYEMIACTIGKDKVERRVKDIISPYELDIYIPTLKYAIEYNGLRWHSEKFGKDKEYHLNKLNLCKEKGIKLLQVFEDEWINHKDIVLSKIKHILKLDETLPRVSGRKCTVKTISNYTAKKFLDKYHIQGFVRSTVYLGAYHEEELVAVMSFKQELKDSDKWELTRFASNYNYICQGVGGKLFKEFLIEYKPNEVKSFADRRWTTDEENNIYIKLGFEFGGYTRPDYRYFKESDGIIRQHKFGFRKQILHKKYGLPLSMTETEMIDELRYTRIYDCGLIKYIWRRN